MTVEKHANVWNALGEGPPGAENLRIRAGLMRELTAWIAASGLTQAQVAVQFGVSQPRVSDLVRGHIDLFSIDALVNMLTAAGLHLDVQVRASS